MQNKMFIPKKCRAGFQKRDGTFTGQLAYVIYYDAKNKIRKEKSWKTWRHDNIDPVEFDNEPTDGFVLNKGITRYPWSSFGDARTMIRAYDSRGIEFEITAQNLTFILMHTNCNKRELEGKFVYAWYGTELVLLPEGCPEYKECMDFSGLQGKRVMAKDLIVGASYRNKKTENLVYLGRFDYWYNRYLYERGKKAQKNAFVFWNEDRKEFQGLASIANVSECVNEDVSPRYGELVTKFEKSKFNGAPVKLVYTKLNLSPEEVYKRANDRNFQWSLAVKPGTDTEAELVNIGHLDEDGDRFIYYYNHYREKGNPLKPGWSYYKVVDLDPKKRTLDDRAHPENIARGEWNEQNGYRWGRNRNTNYRHGKNVLDNSVEIYRVRVELSSGNKVDFR